MASIFTRLKPGQHQSARPSVPGNTKDDILNIMDQFGEHSACKNNKEDNNNTKRRDSHERENIDPHDVHWDAVEDAASSIGTAHPHSYRKRKDRDQQREDPGPKSSGERLPADAEADITFKKSFHT